MKVNGKTKDFTFVRDEGSRTAICYGKKAIDETNSEWHEVYLSKRQHGVPSLEDIKKAVIDDVNERTAARILREFVWNGINVWLSAEFQRNISEAQRLGDVPVRFKLGEDGDGNAVYHTFESKEELDEFYHGAAAYIHQCLEDGWAEKDGIDWDVYKKESDE